jgi:flagellar protein FlaJ
MNMLREAEEERRNVTGQQVMVTYGIFFMFLAIVVVIIFIFVPMMTTVSVGGDESMGGYTGTFNNPCEDFGIVFPCALFSMTCTVLTVDPYGVGCYYVSLFFYVLLIQGIFSGLIAGQLGENSAVAGMKHSMIMVSIVLFVFVFLSNTDMFPT